jgi:uncharacterized protein YigA (DUF484 family)
MNNLDPSFEKPEETLGEINLKYIAEQTPHIVINQFMELKWRIQKMNKEISSLKEENELLKKQIKELQLTLEEAGENGYWLV